MVAAMVEEEVVDTVEVAVAADLKAVVEVVAEER